MASIAEHFRAHLAEFSSWRRDLHAYPETAFEERRTSAFIAGKLREFGLDVTTGVAETGLVGVLRRGEGPAITLRADMDALHIEEANSFAHRSRHPGKMHACGHDGHCVILLAAAKYLAERGRFAGTVNFMFQPAEESEGGAKRMMDEGVLDRFPAEAVFALHNFPGLEVGQFAIREGAMMASFDTFEIRIEGKGGHASTPHLCDDALRVAAGLVQAIDSLPATAVDSRESAVIAVTKFHAGSEWNVIAGEAVLGGGVRTFSERARTQIERRLEALCKGAEAGNGIVAHLNYQRRYPVLVNHAGPTRDLAESARRVAGPDNVDADFAPVLGAEDFAFFLAATPGAYIAVGNGGAAGGCALHNPRYDFNDEIIPLAAHLWVDLVERRLPA